MNLIRFLILLLLLPAPSAYAQQGEYRNFTTIDGLSHNKVKTILQDKQGFLWFGTDYGLNRFNGYEFEVFRNIPGDPTSISHNNIFCLAQDRDGIIWIGTYRNLCSYDPATRRFQTYSSPVGLIHDIREDENGLLWIASSGGLFSYDKKSRLCSRYSFGKDFYVRSLYYEKARHVLWLTTFNGGFKRFDIKNKTSKTYHLPGNHPSELLGNILMDRKGQIWVSSFALGLHNFNPETETITSYQKNLAEPGSLPGNVTSHMIEDSDGKIWIANEDDGLSVFDPDTRKFHSVSKDWKFNGQQGAIQYVFRDDRGIYWIGSGAGVIQYDAGKMQFRTLAQKDYPAFQPSLTMIDDGKNTWVGNYAGIFLLDISAGTCISYNDKLGLKGDRRIFSFIKDGDVGWLGSGGSIYKLQMESSLKNYGLHSLVKKELPIKRKAGVMALLQAGDGNIWVGTQGSGLVRYDARADTFKSYQGSVNAATIISIWKLHMLSPDSLLIGTDGNGVALLHVSKGIVETIRFKSGAREAPEDYSIVKDIYEDAGGQIWIATAGGGLWQTDRALSSFRNYGLTQGLQSMNIEQVLEDNNRQLWLRNNLGLDIMHKESGLVKSYSQKDGLFPGDQDYLLKTSSGFLLRDAIGIHLFSSFDFRENESVPRVHVTGIQVMDQAIPIPANKVLRLPYSRNYISFEYVGLNYIQPHKNTYAYRMEGLEADWKNIRDRRYVSYANLREGKYVFNVKAANNDGFWNETPASITIFISPPFWRTWWFYSLIGLFAGGLIYFIYRARLKKLETEYALRNKISKDLHDDVGSTLSSINALSNLALQHLPGDGENANTVSALGKIQRSSTEMLDAMNDIVWSIQPQNDFIDNIIPRMVSFASEVLEARRISLTCHIPENLGGLRLGLQTSHDFFMIFKESINNLAKYSCAANASITIVWQRPYLSMTIADDGKGFDMASHRQGNGLKNMQSRARNIGADLELLSRPGQGTRVMLKLKLT